MKKLLLPLLVLFFSTLSYSQCDSPERFTGNTGANMTVMLTSDFINSLTISDPNAYLVAKAGDIVVGSRDLSGVSQTTIAIWGDDAQTSDVDGATSGQSISFLLVNGSDLYDVVMPTLVTYVSSSLSIQGSSANATLCVSAVPGCTDSSAINYNTEATEDDGSCVTDTGGCDFPGEYSGNTGNNMTIMLTSSFFEGINATSESAYLAATTSDGLLVGSERVHGVSMTTISVWGDDSQTSELDGASNGQAISFTLVDGSRMYSVDVQDITYTVNGTEVMSSSPTLQLTCGVLEIPGCTEAWAQNYNPAANIDDSSCELTGCMELEADNYNAQANLVGTCEYSGCMNTSACNYNVQANIDDGSCYYEQTGYDCDGVCLVDSDGDQVCDVFEVIGCLEAEACNYNPSATDAGYCSYPSQVWLNCDEQCINDADNDGICDQFEVSGCMDPTAYNYNENASDDDGSCIDVVLGCTKSEATNYNTLANTDNGSCLIEGCTDSSAFNYNSEANINDGSCEATVEGCTDPIAANYNPAANVDDSSCESVVLGCTDASALNFNDGANVDDASCTYVSFNGAWPNDPAALKVTGNNATIAITADLTLDDGDYVGAFYEAQGALVCAGLLIWDTDTANQLIVLWGDDVSTDSKDGLAAGDEVIWMAYDASTQENINLLPTYSVGDNAYMVNATYVISDWLIDPNYGCTDPAYQEYHTNVMVDDGSCSTLWSDLHTNTASQLVDANGQIDTLTTDLLNLNNTFNTTVITMQADYDSVVLDYQGQLFDLNTHLTDSLNGVHAEWDLSVADLVADSLALEAEVAGLELHVSELQSDSTQFEADIASLQSDSLALEVEVADLENHVANLQSDSTAFEVHVGSLQSDSIQFEADVHALETYVSELRSDSTDLEATLAQKIAEYDAQIANLISANNAEVLALNTAHAAVVAGLNADAAAASDGAADLLQQTIDNYELDKVNTTSAHESQISSLTSSFQNDIAILVADSIAFETEILGLETTVSALQADTTQFAAHVASLQADSVAHVSTIASLEADKSDLTTNLNYHSAPLYVDLAKGWNMIGFSLKESMDAAASLESLGSGLHLIKDNTAQVYWPEFGFNSLGVLEPGQGYQIRMYETHNDFTFPYIPGMRMEVTPQVPSWVEDLVIPEHPNDVRALVSVVNMLGQKVEPKDVYKGEVLLYLYSDGTVEKMVK